MALEMNTFGAGAEHFWRRGQTPFALEINALVLEMITLKARV